MKKHRYYVTTDTSHPNCLICLSCTPTINWSLILKQQEQTKHLIFLEQLTRTVWEALNVVTSIRCHTSYGIDDCCWEGCPHIAVGTWTCC
nr:hypothetical protein Iba_chr09cCG1010 [Ipomoea batatas]